MPKRIALLGSAPSSVRLAPLKDPSWVIWACSPGAYAIIGQERMFQPGDAFFELHRWEPPVIGDPSRQVTWFSPEYVQFLAQFKGNVWMTERVEAIRNAQRLPREALIAKYGPFFWTSSLAWMLAMAMEDPEVEEIGLFGVDMAAREEYQFQKPGCLHFITIALQRGIQVTVPPESDLLQPQPLYGVSEWSPMMVKLTARRKELDQRLAAAQQRAAQAQQEIWFLQGAIDDMQYVSDTWTSGPEIDRITLTHALTPPREVGLPQSVMAFPGEMGAPGELRSPSPLRVAGD